MELMAQLLRDTDEPKSVALIVIEIEKRRERVERVETRRGRLQFDDDAGATNECVSDSRREDNSFTPERLPKLTPSLASTPQTI